MHNAFKKSIRLATVQKSRRSAEVAGLVSIACRACRFADVGVGDRRYPHSLRFAGHFGDTEPHGLEGDLDIGDEDLQNLVEVQHLKAAVWALRGQLELARSQYDADKQQLQDTHDAQLADLTATIRVMRAELEQSHNNLLQIQAESAAATEQALSQLRSTIAAMRLELEQAHAERDEAVLQAARHSRDEIAQLHDTIRALRRTLETANGHVD